ncbi:MAG: efflux transporter periplasmic adaptor subunit [Polaromonas sp. 39-63-203]|jgi:RND family efflux transporter MFP subunit|uniref:efflux RND transporter periplasmic adaptor subunit n=1 Tax=Polaromonas sp. TaxID=1869339 RepID=UPI000BC6B334|nr:efflux RND transporter periplasmic adaptor subunit [Polaromonas sp.]OYY52785.1 MAG: efflux transporter periplasmic adaptor subunit [Polaromonas sp. 35-63-240]OYY99403.1 MAG: efflux transporter periplasmic adaptor subunit [Polaromonas sp. 28-63-22]OYZ84039.1 MAG: efflux transporter periplasmic adaptor subunit [Polaromonas sp. 24-62-144]OZA98904.1 MAG: efflux transporter periplasmic adaptor subunit [Polaromonas sp. 39-63-203]HQS31947.1 efflux RND transporter periplasmic adaptor subunit [Polar
MNIIRSFFQARPCACAAALLCAFSLTAHAADRPAKFAVASSQLQAMGIQTAPLQTQLESVRTSYPAQVVIPPNAEQVISSPVAGLISQLMVQPNQLVRAGEPLVRLVSPELGQLQLQLLQASARATLARQAARREQDLFGEGLIAQRRVQEAQAALQEAEATLRQAKTALRLSGMSPATIDKVAASGNPQESLVLSAKQAGHVTDIKVAPGQRVDPATALMNVAQTGTLWLEIQVPVAESTTWAPGTELKVKGRDITAQILNSSAMVTSGSQMVVMRALVRGKAGQVRPGELLSVELPAATGAGGWDLPLSAVAHDGNQAYVFVRTADGFEARPVKLAASAGQRVRIQGPVKAGEQIAVSGVVALKGAWLDEKETK